MRETYIDSAFKELTERLRQLATEVEWHELKKSEWRRGEMPVLVQDSDCAERIRDARSNFILGATSLHNHLNQQATAESEGLRDSQYRSRLMGLEAQFQSLPIPKNL